MIKALVDVANPKLITRFQDVSIASAVTGWATDTGAQPNTASTKLVGSGCTVGVKGKSGLVKDT